MMISTIFIVGLLQILAKTNNYNIDPVKYPHLRNVRVRRSAMPLINVHNKVESQLSSVHGVMKKRSAYTNNDNGYSSYAQNNVNNNGQITSYNENLDRYRDQFNLNNGYRANNNNGIYAKTEYNTKSSDSGYSIQNQLNNNRLNNGASNNNYNTQYLEKPTPNMNYGNYYQRQINYVTSENPNVNYKTYSPYRASPNSDNNNKANNGYGYNDNSNGKVANNDMKTTAPEIAGAYVFGHIGCPQFMRRIGFICAKVDD